MVYSTGHMLCAPDATRLMRGVVEAVFHIQSLGYVHGDLKTDNFLVTRNSQVCLSWIIPYQHANLPLICVDVSAIWIVPIAKIAFE